MRDSTKLSPRLFNAFPSLIASGALALTAATAPEPVRADPGDALGAAVMLGAIGTMAYCAANPDKCGNGRSGTRSGGTRGPVDAVYLNQQQAIWVQQGLASLGYYHGAIDGSLGAGSRAAVRAYQASIGASQTGALTGPQINALVARAPAFAAYGPNDPGAFGADIAPDVTRDELRQIQALLNQAGYDAGPVDGAMGGRTRNAIRAYKAAYGLGGGPVPTRRLLSYLQGTPMAAPMGAPMVQPNAAAAAAPAITPNTSTTATMDAAPMVAGAGFDLLGLQLGMSVGEADSVVAGELGPGAGVETASADTFNGGSTFTLGKLATGADWPMPPSERYLSLFDTAHPENGLLAAFRLVRLPDSVDQATFDSQILPDIVAKYGAANRVGDSLTWVSDPAARARAASDPAALAACGSLGLASVADGAWSSGGGVKLDPMSLGSVTANCGDVLQVRFDAPILSVGLWNSSALSGGGAAAPSIKF